MMADARTLDLPVQVNTSITRRNFDQIESLAELLRGQGIAMWSVFFLVPVGRGVEEERILPEEYEVAFERLWRAEPAAALQHQDHRSATLPPLGAGARRQSPCRPRGGGRWPRRPRRYSSRSA